MKGCLASQDDQTDTPRRRQYGEITYRMHLKWLLESTGGWQGDCGQNRWRSLINSPGVKAELRDDSAEMLPEMEGAVLLYVSCANVLRR